MPETETGGQAEPAGDQRELIEVEPPNAPLPSGLPPVSVEYDPTEYREKARWRIAAALILILSMIVLFSFITLWSARAYVQISELKDIIAVLLGPLAALVGSATGFYFGGKTGTSN